MSADLREAIMLFLSKPRRGKFKFHRRKERKKRADKGRRRVARPGQRGVYVDHTGLRHLVEGEIPSDVEVGDQSATEDSSSSRGTGSGSSSDAQDSDVSSGPDSD
eukprot:Hpha_TRINITY_DN3841_c0_g1::TRINITY_DN3841_c0_g1_i1::g.44509::m.44509